MDNQRFELEIGNIQSAKYNPRKITEKELKGLKNSMDEFGDISGIVYNAKTKTLVTGHHRYDLLKKQFSDLKFVHITGDRFAIESASQGTTGFEIRVVEWELSKEKAANVTANSHTIQGKFDLETLPFLIEEIKLEMPDLDVNFDILEQDLGLVFEMNSGGYIKPQSERAEDIKKEQQKSLEETGSLPEKTIKQIHMHYNHSEYEEIIKKVNTVLAKESLDNYSEVLEFLLDHYLGNNKEEKEDSDEDFGDDED